jgi:hypothetical protein
MLPQHDINFRFKWRKPPHHSRRFPHESRRPLVAEEFLDIRRDFFEFGGEF